MISVKACAASPDRSVASFNRDFFWAAAGLMNATDSRETANKPVIKRRRDVLIKTSEQWMWMNQTYRITANRYARGGPKFGTRARLPAADRMFVRPVWMPYTPTSASCNCNESFSDSTTNA